MNHALAVRDAARAAPHHEGLRLAEWRIIAALQFLALKFFPHFVIERHGQAVVHSRRNPLLQFIDHDRRDCRQVERLGVFDRDPYEFDQFRIGTNNALHLVRNRSGINGEEPCIETLRPFRRRNRPRPELQ